MLLPQAASAGSAIPKVLVSAAPLKPIVDNLLAGVTKSTLLTRPGQDAHSAVMSPSQSRALDNAEIIILPDRHLNTVTTRLAERSKAHVIYLSDFEGADTLPYLKEQKWLGTEIEGDDDSEVRDPHFWLDPARMAALAVPLAEAIGKHAPSKERQIVDNARAWRNHLTRDVQPGLQKVFAKKPVQQRFNSRPFIPYITEHSAYQYFLARFGLPNWGSMITTPEEYLGARSRYDVFKRAGEVTIGCLIAEQETPSVKRLATISSARIVKHNPEALVAQKDVPVLPWIKDDYDRLLYMTAATFQECL